MSRRWNHDPEAVTAARERAGLTKTALASAVGCSLSLISEIESGTRNARADLLARIAVACDCHVETLEANSDVARRPTPETTDVDLPSMRRSQRAEEGHLQELRGQS